jgi:murein DD-endopeptidase MepM/ murein hydrolase activator NlpD
MKHPIIVLAFLVGIIFYSCSGEKPGKQEFPDEPEVLVPDMQYGFDFNKFDIHKGEVSKDWTLSHLFAKYDVTQAEINEAYLISKDSLNFNYILPGNEYFMLCRKDNDTINNLEYAIYIKNAVEYFIFDFRDSVNVLSKRKKVTTKIKEIAARIQKGGNLSFAIDREVKNTTITFPMVDQIANIFSWSIDFFHLQIDDKIKILYEERSVEGEAIGIGNVTAILFNHKERDFYAFRYTVDSSSNYYTEDAKSMKSMFLSAPLKFSRMSSGYNLKRYLKMYGRVKPHLGTDYAAPYGTPIWTTADGTVSKAGYGRGNGNFVKVKHNKQYSTQYLHMSRIAAGIKVGTYVKQGDIIGYVGSTGSSSGNHVCYRFWKDGKQVDSRKQKFNNAKPMDSSHIPQYLKYVDSVRPLLDGIVYPLLDTISEEIDISLLEE